MDGCQGWLIQVLTDQYYSTFLSWEDNTTKGSFFIGRKPRNFPFISKNPLFLVLSSLSLFTWFFFIKAHDLTFLKDSYFFSDFRVSSYSMLKISERTRKIKDMSSGKKALIVCVVKLSVTGSRRWYDKCAKLAQAARYFSFRFSVFYFKILWKI